MRHRLVTLISVGLVLMGFACEKEKRSISISLIEELPRASVLANRPEKVGEKVFNIKGDTRRVLFMHAPSTVEYSLLIPARAQLTFGVGMPPHVWKYQGDGVLFRVEIDQGTEEDDVLYSTYINPKAVEADRRWHDATIDLSPYEGQRVILRFQTDPGPEDNRTLDLAGFSEPTLTGLEW